VHVIIHTMVPIELSQASGVPFYRQVSEQIADAVRAGRLREGDRLPSVRELAAELMVSAITVRAAYDALEQGGLIVRSQGRGTFVARPLDGGRAIAVQEAEAALAAGVRRARGLGLKDDEVRAALDRLLAEEGA
jgi:GntR family transcriptional regulator